jgi:glycosyltransferase involved in cell wall biosynthesis
MINRNKDGKINVLFVIVQMKMGGSEHLVWDLIRNLDRTRFTPHLAWFYEEKPLRQFSELNVPLFYVPKVKRFDFATMRQLGKIIRENKIDVVNAHHFLSLVYSFYGCKLENRIGLIYTEHSVWEIQAISAKWRFMGRVLLRFTDASVGISDKVKAALAATFNLKKHKTFSIPNGVDCHRLKAPKDKDFFKIKYGLAPDDIVLGMVANLKKNKNHIFLLKVFRKLRKQNHRLKLLIIGQAFENDPEGSEDEIRRFIIASRLEDDVLLLGARTDIPELLKALDIFCLTSYREGLPISVIEAMASGLPVVGTNVEGIKDVIVHGKNGFLVELNNQEKLAEALQTLIADPVVRLKIGAESRKIASLKYPLEKCVGHYQLLFQNFSQSTNRGMETCITVIDNK